MISEIVTVSNAKCKGKRMFENRQKNELTCILLFFVNYDKNAF